MKKKFFVIFAFIFIFNTIFLGCIENNQSTSFTLKSWEIYVDELIYPYIFLEFDTTIEEGWFKLEKQKDNQVFWKRIDYGTKNASIKLTKDRFCIPEQGKYILTVIKNWSNPENIVYTKAFEFEGVNISVIDTQFHWDFYETQKHILLTVNITLQNTGDLPGYIYEGKILVNKEDKWNTPDYHWHENLLEVHIMPTQQITIKSLPVDVPMLSRGSHTVNIQFWDACLKSITYFRTLINTP